MSRVLVTGGLGFIGTHLVDALLARGDEVVIVDSSEPQVHGRDWYSKRPSSGVPLVQCSAGHYEVVDSLRWADKVVHLAAVVGVGQSMYQAAEYVRKNTYDTARFMDCVGMNRIERLVVASSMSVYGEGDYACTDHGHLRVQPRGRNAVDLQCGLWDPLCEICHQPLLSVTTLENTVLRPTSVYAITKQDQEQLCLVMGQAYGIPTTALRFFNVYGPGQALGNPYTGVCAIFAARMLNGLRPQVFEDGKQTRDFVHVSDIVRGITLALDDGAGCSAGEAINLGTGVGTYVRSIPGLLSGAEEVTPEYLNRYRVGDVRHCVADNKKAARLLHWWPKVTVAEGMRELGEHWRSLDVPEIRGDALAELKANNLVR